MNTNLKKTVKNLEFHNCRDFLEMAEIIRSSKFTLGNSSLAFPIAEVKSSRLLEACPYFPAAQPHGKNAYDFYFQISLKVYLNIFMSYNFRSSSSRLI